MYSVPVSFTGEPGRVANAKAQFERGLTKKPSILDGILGNIERITPEYGALIEKEKPLIAELMIKLRNRDHDRENDNSCDSSSSSPGDSISSNDAWSFQPPFTSQPPQSQEQVPKAPKRSRPKSPLERALAVPETREKFRALVASMGATEDFEFWEACDDCDRKAHGCAALAKKIISQLMKEMKDNQGQPEKSHMDLALNSAVVAVRYEIMLHKEELRDIALDIVNTYVRDNAPHQVNLSTEVRTDLIAAIDSESKGGSDNDLLKHLCRAQLEMRDLLERKYFPSFSSSS